MLKKANINQENNAVSGYQRNEASAKNRVPANESLTISLDCKSIRHHANLELRDVKIQFVNATNGLEDYAGAGD